MRRYRAIPVVLVVATACTGGLATDVPTGGVETTITEPVAQTTVPQPAATITAPEPSTTTPTTPPPTTTTTVTYDLRGTVTTPKGAALIGAIVAVGDVTAVTGSGGFFSFAGIEPGEVSIRRPAWEPQTLPWDGSIGELSIELEPRVVRGLRLSRYTAGDEEAFDRILELAAGSTVNALVFDTKDEEGEVLYETSVEEAHEIGAVNPMYEPSAALERAKAAGLYTITRVVTFEDRIRSRERPEAKLAGWWMDPLDPANWEYPLALGVEACDLGFDEIQFDYVRFPAGRTAAVAANRRPSTQEERTAAIVAFLDEARNRLHARGCAVAADIFGIVLSSRTDEGIGQRPEELSSAVDVISPMIYPSHYSPGWIGFADPNDHPGPVTARALDDGAPRFEGTAILRPWLQAFYYNGSQVQAGIDEAEERGLGWMLWNAGGNYAESWLPSEEEPSTEE